MADTKVIAVFDANSRLVGTTIVAADQPGVDPGDLPLNGSYKYDNEHEAFIPLGHGFGKVKTRQPHSNELVMRKIIEMLQVTTVKLPIELVEWATWYDRELRRRDEEFSARPK